MMDWSALTNWLKDLAKSVFDALWNFVADVFAWLLGLFFDLVISLLNLIDWASLNLNPAQYIDGLPDYVINMMSLIGLGPALSIIIGALVIRLMLGLIPFVRIGG